MIIRGNNTIWNVLRKFNKKKEVSILFFVMPFIGKLDYGILEEIKKLKKNGVRLILINRKVDELDINLFDEIYLSISFHCKYIRSEKHIYIGSANLYKSKKYELGVFIPIDNEVLVQEQYILHNAEKIK